MRRAPKLPLDIASQQSGLLNGLLTDDGLNVEFRLVVYDVEKVAQAILDSELSDEFAGSDFETCEATCRSPSEPTSAPGAGS